MNRLVKPPLVRIVLQARMGSRRRPGKTLAEIDGRSLLARCCERLQAAVRGGHERGIGRAWQLVAATSTAAADEAVAQTARRLGVAFTRGSESNVLDRFLAATADLHDDDLLVRATADNPLYCPELTTALVVEHLRSANDYTGIAEALSPCVPEVVRVGALRQASARNDLDDYCREHVTPCFRRPGAPFRATLLPPTWRGLDPRPRLTVDTQDDIDEMQRLYGELRIRHGDNPPAWRLAQIYEAASALAGQAQRRAA